MKFKLLLSFFLLSATFGWGQIAIPNTTPVTENFDGMGISASATLPSNWKMSVAGAVSPTWAAGGNFTAVSQQASTGAPTTGGRYNWGTTPTTDRALGCMTSGGYASPNSIMSYYRNTNASNLIQLTVSYNLERYRINTTAASVQFYYSLDGTTWVAVASGDVAAASLPTGASAYSFGAPLTVNVAAFNITGLSVATNSDIYLRWNLVTGASNSQGIGIDDVSVTATFGAACTPPSNPSGTISAGANPSCGPTTLTYSAPNANLYWQTTATGTSTSNPTTSSYPVPSTGTYYVRAYDGSSCWSTGTASVSVTINPIPGTPTTANPVAVCQGASVNVVGTGSSNATSYTFWDSPAGGTQYTTGGGYTVSGTTLTTPTALAAGTYTYYVQGESATCSGTTRKAVTVTINAVPANPSGTISALANPSCGPATLNYSAPNATLYWQTTPGGTSTSNPTTSPFTAATSGTYYVNAYNGSCFSAGSVSLAVTVNTATAITSQPTNNFVVVGNTGTFTVAATGSSLSYQWQVSTDGGTTWSNIGTNSNSYTTPATTFAMNGYLYQVIVSGGAPCSPVTSDAAELFVTTAACLGSNFDSSTTLPGGWSGSSSNDALAAHYLSAPNCRALTSGSDLITSATNNPIGINFYVDASGSGGQLGTLYYRVGAAAWVSVGTFTATTAGSIVSFDLSSSPNLSGLSNVSFRIVSSTNSIYIDNLNVYCGLPCTPATISSVTPASGPVGTEVTITASSGSLVGTTATFNGVATTVVSSSATQLVVTVPSGATTGSLVIADSQPCEATTAFTVITKDNTSCQGNTLAFTDLIISEVYDSQSNNVWHMELYNPTAAPINLATSVYKFERYGTIGDAAPTRTIALTGVVPAGGVFLADLGDSGVPCVKTWDFVSSAQGINAEDEIRLTKNNVAVDVVYCPNEIGYTIKRKATAAGPTMTYNAADWDLLSAEDCSDLGLFPASVKNTPTITVQPSVNVDCSTTSIVISVVATEGFPNGNALAYQWYVAAPGSATWTALTNTGVYSGVTTAALNISSVVGLDNYQYYCQVRENTATCFIASNAVIIKGASSTTWNGTAWS
ncbi:MAG TPA: hypothetical protein VLB74_12995, partial [Flavobacterium sp.]|uniref:Ig-like domain-containing protein n=1 Tax=Flavobacterium sp. TaxID=239 RepID=UPI002C51C9A8